MSATTAEDGIAVTKAAYYLISNDATGQKNAKPERFHAPNVVQTITLPKLHAEPTVKEVHNLINESRNAFGAPP
jgi:hypothetical protein